MKNLGNMLRMANQFLKRTRIISKGVHHLGYGMRKVILPYVRVKKGKGRRMRMGGARGRRCMGGALGLAGGALHPVGSFRRMRNLPMAY
jgi:hypothetical protein